MPDTSDGRKQLAATVRDYHESDREQFLSIVCDLQAFEIELYDRMLPVEEIGDWYIATLNERCAAEKGSILVAERDGELVGYATIFAHVEQKGEFDEIPFAYGCISHIAVRPTARGLGVGKALMAECEARARAAGRQWLRIAVLADNVDARAIYERLGFRDHLITMEKSLR
jgi:ribosomal protein S18 acetylase RimI-like enzyme